MGDEGRPAAMTFRRAVRAPEFWLLVVATLAAAGGLGAWIVLPLTVAGLSISSLPKYIALWPRARAAGAVRVWWQTVALSLLNALATAGAAYVLGCGIGWLWS